MIQRDADTGYALQRGFWRAFIALPWAAVGKKGCLHVKAKPRPAYNDGYGMI